MKFIILMTQKVLKTKLMLLVFLMKMMKYSITRLKQALFFPTKISWSLVEDQPLNEYTTPFLATMAFTCLFPDGKGDLTNPSLCGNITLVIKYSISSSLQSL
jgi:hypothetical protein